MFLLHMRRVALASLCFWFGTGGYVAAQDAPRIAAPKSDLAYDLIVSSNGGANPPFTGVFVNDFLGANRWTSVGFTGTGAIIANVEGGWAWGSTVANPNRHQSLPVGAISQFLAGPGALTTQTAFRSHATGVTQIMGGRGGGNVQNGMAQSSTLWTGNIATSFGGGGSFNAPFSSTGPLYRDILRDGVAAAGGARAHVVNSSWGALSAQNGNELRTATIDAMLYESRAAGVRGAGLFVVAAGNDGPATNTVGLPASGFNGLVVGALTSDTSNPLYNSVPNFSSRSPSSYYNPNTDSTISNARARVDIAAPGTNLTLAAMQTDGVDGGATNLYFSNQLGTSFSAPFTAGGIGLMVSAARNTLFTANPDAVDGRVLKAVVMNSADKTAGWTNNASNVGGVFRTTQGMDFAAGTGRVNFNRAFDQYVPAANGGRAGTTDVAGLTQGNLGAVDAIGWDFGEVLLSGTTTNEYILPLLQAGSTFTATLSWYADNNIDFTTPTNSTFGHFLDLNLALYTNDNGSPGTLLADSISLYNSSEHIFFTLPAINQSYILQVSFNAANTQDYNFDGVTSEFYGLSWSGVAIPEPTTIGLLAIGGAGAYLWRRQRKLRQLDRQAERQQAAVADQTGYGEASADDESNDFEPLCLDADDAEDDG
jgi:hypothetical protein